MKIFNTEQIKAWDDYTIKEGKVDSLALMETASTTFTNWFVEEFPNKDNVVFVFCGNGNNGGDGLVISRLLIQASYKVNVVLQGKVDKRSNDNSTNLEVLQNMKNIAIHEMTSQNDLPEIEDSCLVVDAIFGTGLKGELRGLFKDVIRSLNELKVTRVAVDLPSGLNADGTTTGVVFHAEYTFSFEQPKLAFLFPENHKYVGQWQAQSIGLSSEYYLHQKTSNFLLTEDSVLSFYQEREKFEHKGNFGHALLITGSKGKIGASILSTFACLRAGCGLTTVYTPTCGYSILQTAVPEAMVLTDTNEDNITGLPELEGYNVIGVGCGIGTSKETQKTIIELVENASQPLVLDADALNNIASYPTLLQKLPKGSILTPHPKEFDRLFGTTSNDFERNELQRKSAKNLGCYILLKGAHSCIATPDGNCYFNTTGNPGMATAGSGDVLTGIITGLVAQNYSSKEAVLMGVYLHGLAGDLASKKLGQQSIIARDIIDFLPNAFVSLVS